MLSVEFALLLIVALPLAGLVAPVLLDRAGFNRETVTLSAAVPNLAALGILLSGLPAIVDGATFTATWPWFPALGLNLAFRLDGLAFLFALLILGIGILIVIYAYYYLTESDPVGRFYSFLMFFMGAMVGVVISENILLLSVFWELTSLSSFLLIGYWSHKSIAREGARMALAITGLGGLALIGGMVLLGQIAGSYSLTEILASGQQIQSHALFVPMLLLILLGCFTKSAQFPFHSWLPNAMTAPTPVSAYLHSATMVKAGVFLLARLHPALSGNPTWFFTVTFAGVITFTFASYVALYKHDLKGLLAYSTISHLGLITALFGMSKKLAVVAGVFHIMNHAAFKASLFMSAGIIDHEAGSRDIRVLNGLSKSMPLTMWVAGLGAAAMAGVPLMNGFLSKELFFKHTLHLEPLHHIPWLLPVIATIGGIFSVAYSIRFFWAVFMEGEGEDMPGHPHDPPFGMLAPVYFLITICVVVGVAPLFKIDTVQPLLTAASEAVIFVEHAPHYHIKLWHGFSTPLMMTLVAFGAGFAVYIIRQQLFDLAENVPIPPGKQVFEGLVNGAEQVSSWITNGVQNGSLQRYLALLIVTAIVLSSMPYVEYGWQLGGQPLTPIDPISFTGWALIVVGSLGTVYFYKQRFISVIVIGIVGLLISLTFVRFSGPDLALTQLSVEVVTVLLLLLALYVLPESGTNRVSMSRKLRDGLIAAGAGVATTAMVAGVLSRSFESISDFHLQQSVPGGGGTNVVNVILVDFRGFDTLGEITVLIIAGLGVWRLLKDTEIERKISHSLPYAEDMAPVILAQITRPMMPLLLLISAYIFLRGHNYPGGGFIAGLFATVALIMQHLASGINWTESRIRFRYGIVAVIGGVIGALAGFGSWLFGYPFLTGTYDYVKLPILGKFELATAMIFDLGVFLAVVGSLMIILSRLADIGRTSVEYNNFEEESDPWKP